MRSDRACTSTLGSYSHCSAADGDGLCHGTHLWRQSEPRGLLGLGPFGQDALASDVEVLGRAIDWCFLGRLGLSLHLCSQLCHGGTDLAIWRRFLLCGRVLLHLRFGLRGAQLRCLETQQSSKRPQPVLWPGHWLRHRGGGPCGGCRVGGRAEPGTGLEPGEYQWQGDPLVLALVRRPALSRRRGGRRLPAAAPRGVRGGCHG
mmetsp:Transcript_62934/g.99854  ORF Transcript_62934/g.99854 Transcript_62934/m.99854 type:complete len:203 (+) Transcript_62934:317-925(+)